MLLTTLIALLSISFAHTKAIKGILILGGPDTNAATTAELFTPGHGSSLLPIALPTSIYGCGGVFQRDNRVVLLTDDLTGQTFYLDLCSNTTSNGPSMRIGRNQAASAKINDSIIVCGGFVRQPRIGLTINKSCEILSNDNWEQINETLHTGVYDFTLATSGNTVDAIGGAYNLYDQTPGVYRLQAGEWTLASRLTTPREGHGTAALRNGSLLVCGGEYDSSRLRSCEVNSEDGVWSAGPDLNMTRSQHTMINYEGVVYAIGGYGYGTTSKAARSIEWLDDGSSSSVEGNVELNDGKWMLEADVLTVNREQHCATVVDIDCE